MSTYIHFLQDTDDLQIAIAARKPTVIRYYAQWCPACSKTAHEYAALARKYAHRANFAQIDIDNTRIFTKNVTKLPTYHIYHRGRIVDIISGANLAQVEAAIIDLIV